MYNQLSRRYSWFYKRSRNYFRIKTWYHNKLRDLENRHWVNFSWKVDCIEASVAIFTRATYTLKDLRLKFACAEKDPSAKSRAFTIRYLPFFCTKLVKGFFVCFRVLSIRIPSKDWWIIFRWKSNHTVATAESEVNPRSWEWVKDRLIIKRKVSIRMGSVKAFRCESRAIEHACSRFDRGIRVCSASSLPT